MNIKRPTALLIPLWASALLAACDIGPSGLRSGFDRAAGQVQTSSSSSSTAQGTPVTIAGVAAKGIILNGVVNIHPIIDGVLSSTTIGSARTSTTNGAYSVNVDDYRGNPFVVRVTTDDTTTMRCDLAAGCGTGVSFGQTVPLNDSEFNLDAIVPPITVAQTTVNLSVLTDTATEVALTSLSSLSNPSITTITQSVTNANSAVANRFGILGNLTSLPVVDLTNPASLVDVTQDVLEYNLLSCAVVGQLVNGGPGASITQAVRNFASQYATNNGLADREETASNNVTLAEILAEASRVITSIQTIDTTNLINLHGLRSVITANQQLANSGSTTPTTGVVSDPNLSELAKVKAMVGELRKVGTGLEQGIDAEQSLIDAALDDDSGDVLAAVNLGVEAIGSAWQAYDENDTIANFQDTKSGLTVGITTVSGVTTYSVDGNVQVESGATVALVLSGVDGGSNQDSSEANGVETLTATVDLEISGSAVSAMVSLQLVSGTIALDVSGTNTETQTQTTMTESFAAEFSAFAIRLKVILTETAQASADPVTFDGSIGFSVTGLTSSETETTTQTTVGQFVEFMSTWTSETAAEAVSASIAGKFSAASGSAVSASISLNADGTNFNYSCSGASDSGSVCSEEDAENYAGISFATVFSLSNLGDISVPVQVLISGDRSGLDDAELAIKIRYGAVVLSTSYSTTEEDSLVSTMVISDQNSVMLTLTETEDSNGEVTTSGSVTLNDVEYATIGETLGQVVISYSDNTNESLW